ncbi:hypothetical protein KY290_037016 [Solanum tuberosum]|uniref:Uncharacterized protein n=1 Tax=Solanum tuberosum TaxID=4113 RepID=A0ABQ7TU99_SOLTU|nr:hypothetical protein KY289_036508 [Solanum tuberosum]KAH0738311.1 hypothetical protein KY290_037016 [Solanum tuberosum]
MLLQHYEEQVGGANEQIVDKDWGVNEQDVGTNDHDGGANDKYLGANEQNVVQDDVDGVSPVDEYMDRGTKQGH